MLHVSVLQYSYNSILFLFYILLCMHYYRSTDDAESYILMLIQYVLFGFYFIFSVRVSFVVEVFSNMKMYK